MASGRLLTCSSTSISSLWKNLSFPASQVDRAFKNQKYEYILIVWSHLYTIRIFCHSLLKVPLNISVQISLMFRYALHALYSTKFVSLQKILSKFCIKENLTRSGFKLYSFICITKRLHSRLLRQLSPESSLTSSILPTREPGGIVMLKGVVSVETRGINIHIDEGNSSYLFLCVSRDHTRPPPSLSLLFSFFLGGLQNWLLDPTLPLI